MAAKQLPEIQGVLQGLVGRGFLILDPNFDVRGGMEKMLSISEGPFELGRIWHTRAERYQMEILEEGEAWINKRPTL